MKLKTKAAFTMAGLLALALIGLTRPAITAMYSSPMHDVDNPARQPVQAQGVVQIQPGHGTGQAFAYTVPAGQRLVIDTVSARAIVPTGQNVSADVNATSGVVFATILPFSPFVAKDPTHDTAAGTISVQAYADPGTTIAFFADRNAATTGSALVFFGFAGHLVNLP